MTMQQTVTQHYRLYHPERLPFSREWRPEQMKDGFVLRIRRDGPLPAGEQTLFDIPGMLRIYTGVHRFPEELSRMDAHEKGEGFYLFTDEDGRSPYIEVALRLHASADAADSRQMTLGLPLLAFSPTEELFLLFDGARLAWIVGGEIADLEHPVGVLVPAAGDIFVSDAADIGVCCAVDRLESEAAAETVARSMAYYSPRGYNTWAGDVTNFYHDGTYHFLFFFDRHHHTDRFGGGAHSVCHVTTRDFVHWVDHGELRPIDTQWASFGTGTMLFFDGRYYYIHGLHSSRVVPADKTGSVLLRENFSRTGCFEAVSYAVLAEHGLYPSGANYLVSEDGIRFVPGEKQIHCAENPSVYADENGGLVMYAGYGASGVWRAPAVDGPWVQADTDMPIENSSSPVRNSTECPSIFSWNGYTYLLMGFLGFWQSDLGGARFTDLAAVGEDIYDGLCVPMVTNCDGRYLLAGWVGGMGWGSLVLHRELCQHEGGRLGIRWLPELTPDPDALPCLARCAAAEDGERFTLDGRTSYYLEFTVDPQAGGRVGLAVSGNGTPFVLSFDTARQKVQARIGSDGDEHGFLPELKAMYEYIPEMTPECTDREHLPSKDIHIHARDFAIAKVRELTGRYTVRIILHHEPKTDGLVLDAEIGGGRTFVTNRPFFRATALRLLCADAAVRDLRLCTLDETY